MGIEILSILKTGNGNSIINKIKNNTIILMMIVKIINNTTANNNYAWCYEYY